MDRDSTPRRGYAQSVFDDTQRYIQKLLDGNDQLRRKLAAIESEKVSLEKEHLALREEVVGLRERLARCRQDHAELQNRLHEVETESRGYADEYLQLERRNSNLVNLYVASYGLHGTLDRPTVLQTIKEIVINLVGSEELAILELGDDGRLRLADSFGLAEDRCHALSGKEGLVGHVTSTGEPWVDGRSAADAADRTDAEEHLSACIPLRVDDHVFGAVAIFRLLPQKSSGLVDVDYEILDLLAAQAGTALYCSTLYARHGATAGPSS
jgi:transcriptional regulator with GAF, ATPase, and Fis domain